MGLLSMCLPRRQTGCDGLAGGGGGGPCGFGEAAGAELGQDILNRPLITLACSPLPDPLWLCAGTPPKLGLQLERTSTADFAQSKAKLSSLQALLDTTPTTRQAGLADGTGGSEPAEPTPRPTPLRAVRQPFSPLEPNAAPADEDAAPAAKPAPARQRNFGALDAMLAQTPRSRLRTANTAEEEGAAAAEMADGSSPGATPLPRTTTAEALVEIDALLAEAVVRLLCSHMLRCRWPPSRSRSRSQHTRTLAHSHTRKRTLARAVPSAAGPSHRLLLLTRPVGM